jgi:hypothetical protein
MGVNVICGDLLQQAVKVRHNPDAIAAVAVKLALDGRRRRKSPRT